MSLAQEVEAGCLEERYQHCSSALMGLLLSEKSELHVKRESLP